MYSTENMLRLMSCLFDPAYIEAHAMYQKAVSYKTYADTWLTLSLLCTVPFPFRILETLQHPKLPAPPEEVFQMVMTRTLADGDALEILESALGQFTVGDGHMTYKMYIPEVITVHLGRVLAIAEAHSQLAGKTDRPLVHKPIYCNVSSQFEMEVGILIRNSGFSAKTARMYFLEYINTLKGKG